MIERLRLAKEQHGQVMVLFALMLPVLIGMMGLGVDAAKIFQERRQLQTVADLSALAGASQLPDDPIAAQVIAQSIAAENGAASGEVAAVGGYGGNASSIEVTIDRDVDLFFMPVLGLGSVNVSVRAVAERALIAGMGGTSILAKKDYHCWERTVMFETGASNIVINGHVHSNGGLTVKGSNNTINGGKLTYKDGLPVYPYSSGGDDKINCGTENDITGTNPNIEIAAASWQDWPVLYSASDFPCTYTSSDGDLNKPGAWWENNDPNTRHLNSGVICASGGNRLRLSLDNVTGNVTFRGGQIDISGSNTRFTAYKNGVLFASDSDCFPNWSGCSSLPAMRLRPSGGRWEGMIYNRAWNTGNYVEGGQLVFRGSSGFQQIGPVIAWAVTLDGSNWSITGTFDLPTPEPMRLVE